MYVRQSFFLIMDYQHVLKMVNSMFTKRISYFCVYDPGYFLAIPESYLIDYYRDI